MDTTVSAEGLPPDVAAALADPNRRVERYVLVKELGRGAMGAVWRAFDTTLKRYVAIKLLLDAAASGELDVKRVVREASTAGKLQHPGIVQVLDIGNHRGRPFIIMELVEGGSLDKLFAKGPLAPERIAELVREIALALAHAHERGVIHRDVKPANILLDEDGRPRISDFGLARDTLGSSSGLSKTGDVLGTPAYMAPEQAAGDPKWHGAHTDVYALGVILYRALVGVEPFTDSPSLDVFLRRVLKETPPAPHALNPDADRALSALALECMEKAPERRPTAQELAEKLARFLGSGAYRALDAGDELAPPRAVSPTLIAFALGAVVIAVALVASLAVVAMRKQTAPSPAPATPAPSAAPTPKPSATSPTTPPTTPPSQLPEICRSLLLSQSKRVKLVSVLGGYEWKNADVVHALRFLPGGGELVTVGRTIKVWDAATGRDVRVLCDDKDDHVGVSLSADGKRLLEHGGRDGARLRDVATGSVRHILASGEAVTDVALSGDAKRALIGVASGAVELWDAEGGARMGSLPCPKGHVAVAISRDGRRGLASLDDGHVQLLDLDGLAPLKTLDNPARIATLGFFADEKRAIGGSEDQTFRIWNLEAGGEPLFVSPTVHSGGGVLARVSQDGQRIVSRGLSNVVFELWAAPEASNEFARLRSFGGFRSFARALDLSPDGKRVAAAGFDQEVRLWDVESAKDLRDVRGHACAITALGLSPDGKRALSGSADGVIKLWDVETGRELRTFPPGHGQHVFAIRWLDGKRALTVGSDCTIRLWDVASGGNLKTFATGCWAHDVRPLEGLRHCVSADDKGVLRIWDLATGTSIRSVQAHGDEGDSAEKTKIGALAVSPDGRLVLTAGHDGTLQLWRWDSISAQLAPVRVFSAEPPMVVSDVAFAGPHRAVSRHMDGSVQFWDVEQVGRTGPLARIAAHAPGGEWCRLAASGPRAVSGGDSDRTLRLWDVEGAIELDRIDLGTSTDYAISIAFAPDGRSFLAGTFRGVILRFGIGERGGR